MEIRVPSGVGRSRPPLIFWAVFLLVLGTLGLRSAAQDAAAAPEDAAATPVATAVGSRPAVLLTFDDVVLPIGAELIAEAIARAEEIDAAVLVIQLSTPGGLVTSTRKITQAILESEVPVVVFVGPRGAQAASAGFYILMSSDIAAMAPGTNTGAAHPVAGGGQDIEGDMRAKVEQDAAANIRAMASERGRNLEMAEAAVIDSRSFTAQEAFDLGLIEVVAADVPSLLEDIDGLEVKRADGTSLVLATAESTIERIEMGRIARFLAAISHPQIALLLISFGTLGLYVEFSHPGLIFPGAIGAILLILGFYSLSVLPLDYAGLALIVLSLVLFGAELVIPSYGILTFGGAAALILGSLMVFRSPDPALRVDLRLILLVTGSIVFMIGLLMSRVMIARRTPVVTGVEGLVRKTGTARTDIELDGKVDVHGEVWRATAEEPIARGAPVEIVAVEGLTLRVRPADRTSVG